jgi:FlaA1/EpsC-like NDP-sugar epimerase
MFIPFDEQITEDKRKRISLMILITILPILIVSGMYLLSIENYALYKRIASEDNLIEYLQVLAYTSSSVLAFLLSLRFRRFSKIMFVIFLLLSFGFLFVAGEEISWGQSCLTLR